MKKLIGIIIGSILFELAKFAANSACLGLFFQPEEGIQIKNLSKLEE